MNTKSRTCAGRLFMGLDFSTQRLKATLIDSSLGVVHESEIDFDRSLPEFKTRGGVHRHSDGLTVTAPPLLWVAALDALLDAMRRRRFPFKRVACVSGSGQQHGSVYLRHGADRVLAGLDPALPLRGQLEGCFSIPDSPVWMDSSTSAQCRARDRALGGAQAVAALTGSRSCERFTGNQIAKIRSKQPEAYAATGRIALVSSFCASLLIGDYAPIEPGDGAGMNLMNLRTRAWSPAALACTAKNLAARLGAIVPSHTVIGPISPWFAARHGFSRACRVVAFSGDNPNSLAALRLERPGDMAISMGTSDTVFGALSSPRPSATEGHIFGSPIDPEGYMALIGYKNGSLTREWVRDRFAGGSWPQFERCLAETQPGNRGRIGFYYREPEMTPPVFRTGVWRFDCRGRPIRRFNEGEDARAVIEGQFLSMRLHGRNIGLAPRKILATGGASVNRSILKTMADVFGAPVYTSCRPNSASLGAAYRALHGWDCARKKRYVSFMESLCGAPPFERAAEPDPALRATYDPMLERYAKLERSI